MDLRAEMAALKIERKRMCENMETQADTMAALSIQREQEKEWRETMRIELQQEIKDLNSTLSENDKQETTSLPLTLTLTLNSTLSKNYRK